MADLPLDERIARAVVRMARSHDSHYPVIGDRSKVACRGSSDPLTGHFCQFEGTSKEQVEHLIERATEAARTILRDEGILDG